MVIVGIVVSQAEQVVGEVGRSGLVEELLLGRQLGDVGDIPVDLSLLLFVIFSVAVEATIERTGLHKAVIGGCWCWRMCGSV